MNIFFSGGVRQLQPVIWPHIPTTSPATSSGAAHDEEMLPPLSRVPIAVRRSSVQMIVPETLPHEELKQEVTETPRSSPEPNSPSEAVADLASTKSPSASTLQQFVSKTSSLPSISVDNYLTRIEVATLENNNIASYAQKDVSNQVINDAVTHSSASPIHSTSPRRNGCSSMSDIVQPQIISDISQQTSAAQMHPSPMITNHNTVSELVQSRMMTDISVQSPTSQLHSPPILNNCSTISPPVKQARYSNGLLSSVPPTIDNNVPPLASSLLIQSDTSMTYQQSLNNSTSVTNTSQCISEILTSCNAQNTLEQQSPTSLISESQNLQYSGLGSSAIIQPTSTEKLDVFVNSAAESHIGPGQNSLSPPVPTSAEVRNLMPHETSHINQLLPGVQSSCPSTTSSLCSLLSGPPISTLEQHPQTTISQTPLHPSPISSTARISDLMVTQSISPEILGNNVNIPPNLSSSSQYPERQGFSQSQEMQTTLIDIEKPKIKEEYNMLMEITSMPCTVPSTNSQPDVSVPLTASSNTSTTYDAAHSTVKKNEEGIPLGNGIQEITQMSEHDLISYINPSCFDQGKFLHFYLSE